IYACIGIHPHEAKDVPVDYLDILRDLSKHKKVVAIGEIGLDYSYDKDNKEKQIKYFTKQLDLAIKYNLPVIIHTRDSIQDTFDAIKDRKLTGIIHCFSGSIEMAREFIKKGFLLGIGGVLTFKNSKLHEVIENIDITNLVLETDSPFLTPEPFRGKQNNPSNVYYVAKKIAEIKKMTTQEVIDITAKNVSKIFDI
ncbi:MAG: TatD family hydrolase, partial [Tenericutes bacterium]|nr:TatD family hydrolase [Mycoplasmatota bacterium]